MKNKALLDAIITNAIDGIITINEDGIVESINPAACKLFRYNPAEVIGKNISMLMPAPENEKHDRYLRNFKRTEEPHIIGIGRDVIGKRKDGTPFPFRLGVSEVNFEGQRIFAGFIHDLSYQKEVENELKKTNMLLEEKVEERTRSLDHTINTLKKTQKDLQVLLGKEKHLGELKGRLLSMASHELRTPLSTVQLSASLIEKYYAQDGFELLKHVHRIKKSILSLTEILNDFLYLEKIESGKIQAKVQEFNIKEFAEELNEEMQAIVKKNQIINYTHSGESSQIKQDKNLLRNCIINLISNSIKYSEEGTTITFLTEISNETLKIKIIDQGIGIPKEDQKHLFEAFFRAQNTGSIPGTGLGLNIVSRYIKLMNGTIEFSSNTNEGTEFTIILQHNEQNFNYRRQ